MNDIAIIKLESEAILNSAVQPACLPIDINYKPKSDVTAWIAGWGILSYAGNSPDVLQNANITYYFDGSNQCSQYISSDIYVDWDKQICAGIILRQIIN